MSKKSTQGLGHQTGQNTPKSNFFCQENLTKPLFWVENKDNNLSSQKMGKLGNLAGALTLSTALAAPALAEEPNTAAMQLAAMTNGEVTDCLGFVREQRDLARENNIAMSRADQRSLLHQCNRGELQERIAEQERIIAALNEQIEVLNLRVDENGRLIDEQGRELARLIAINGQLILRRQEIQADTAALNAEAAASRVRQEQLLREFQSILDSLATS